MLWEVEYLSDAFSLYCFKLLDLHVLCFEDSSFRILRFV